MPSEKSHSKTIALIDDDLAYLAMIEDFLLFQGLGVISFSEPENFLSSICRAGSSYSLVISDINMPKISGLELLREVRVRLPTVPVIMMTAAPNGRDEAISRELGARGYLAKPCALTEIFDQVQTALAVNVA